MSEVKGQKVRAFYTKTKLEKPIKTYTRHFIHSKASGGFWAHIRDLTLRERLTNEAIGHQVVVVIRVGYNPKILDLWEQLIFIDEKGTTYRLKEKPDEYEYSKSDIKLTAYAFNDDKSYEEDVYE